MTASASQTSATLTALKASTRARALAQFAHGPVMYLNVNGVDGPQPFSGPRGTGIAVLVNP